MVLAKLKMLWRKSKTTEYTGPEITKKAISDNCLKYCNSEAAWLEYLDALGNLSHKSSVEQRTQLALGIFVRSVLLARVHHIIICLIF